MCVCWEWEGGVVKYHVCMRVWYVHVYLSVNEGIEEQTLFFSQKTPNPVNFSSTLYSVKLKTNKRKKNA